MSLEELKQRMNEPDFKGPVGNTVWITGDPSIDWVTDLCLWIRAELKFILKVEDYPSRSVP